MSFIEELQSRFFRYVAISSQSDASKTVVPTSDGQWKLGNLLIEELKQMGLTEVKQDEHAIVTATLPGNCDGPTIGFCAHLDTVDVSLSPVIKPQIKHFTGEDLLLNEDQKIYLKVKDHPELLDYLDQDLIVTDGTSVLGADNKAAITNIMTALNYLTTNNVKHSTIKVAFVPDEEIGLKGSKLLNLDDFKVDFAYTIDSCKEGELVYETFNAGSVYIDIDGVSAHPMSAKGVLVNPLLVATDFINMFDRNQTPECTEKKEGYWWFTAINADATHCKLIIHIRDFDLNNYNYRKDFVQEKIEELRKLHPRAKIAVRFEDVYQNIANTVDKSSRPIKMLYQAYEDLGIKANTIAMRGGTDGSQLSSKGIVTPNYFTGALNFHSNAEFLPLKSFEKSLMVTLKLVELACE